jgi:replicative DNA helicase
VAKKIQRQLQPKESETPMSYSSIEALLISAVLRQEDHRTPLIEGVAPDWFLSYRVEWEWIETYIKRHHKAPSKSLFKVTFPDFVVLKSDDVDYCIAEVKESYLRRSLVNVMSDLAEKIKSQNESIGTINFAQQELMKLQMSSEGGRNETDIVEEWSLAYDEAARRYERTNEKGISGVPTGFPTLDNLTGGVQEGDYWIVAARLGQGKTWTLIRMACSALYAGMVVQYDALEQSRAQIAMRTHSFLSSEYGKQTFRSMDLMNGKDFDLKAYKEFLTGLKSHTAGKFFVNDTSRGRLNPSMIAAQIERNKPDVVFIDYLTLMNTGGDDWKAIANLSAELKGIAMHYQIPIIAAAQINRMAIGNDVPGPEHLAGADAIGQDADCVITMKQMSAHVIKMRLAKFRHGSDGQTWLNEFRPNSGKFDEISSQRADEITQEDKESQV